VAGKRFLIVADKFCNRDIVDVIAEKFLGLRGRLPMGGALKSGMFPPGGGCMGLIIRGRGRCWG